MNITTLANMMSMAYKTEHPQNALTALLFDRDGSALHASFSAGSNQVNVAEFTQYIVPEPVEGTPLHDDLQLLRETPVADADYRACVVKLVYFMTQGCHVFGTMSPTPRVTLTMHASRPIVAYADYNVPCCYVWVDLRKTDDPDFYLPHLVKHNMPDEEKYRPIRVVLRQPAARDDLPLCMDLDTMSCTNTIRPGAILLRVAGDGRFTCEPLDGPVESRANSYVMVLSVCKVFSQAVLHTRGTGAQRVINTFLHDGPL